MKTSSPFRRGYDRVEEPYIPQTPQALNALKKFPKSAPLPVRVGEQDLLDIHVDDGTNGNLDVVTRLRRFAKATSNIETFFTPQSTPAKERPSIPSHSIATVPLQPSLNDVASKETKAVDFQNSNEPSAEHSQLDIEMADNEPEPSLKDVVSKETKIISSRKSDELSTVQSQLEMSNTEPITPPSKELRDSDKMPSKASTKSSEVGAGQIIKINPSNTPHTAPPEQQTGSNGDKPKRPAKKRRSQFLKLIKKNSSGSKNLSTEEQQKEAESAEEAAQTGAKSRDIAAKISSNREDGATDTEDKAESHEGSDPAEKKIVPQIMKLMKKLSSGPKQRGGQDEGEAENEAKLPRNKKTAPLRDLLKKLSSRTKNRRGDEKHEEADTRLNVEKDEKQDGEADTIAKLIQDEKQDEEADTRANLNKEEDHGAAPPPSSPPQPENNLRGFRVFAEKVARFFARILH